MMTTLRLQFIILSLSVSTITSAQQITDSIPFKYEKGWIFINAKIDGQDCRLLFDTGDPLTRVFPKSLGWTYTNDKSNKSAFKKIKQAQLQTGTYGQQVDVFAFGATITCSAEIDGVIGYNFMKDKIWMIDYKKEKIYILASAPPINKSLHVIPLFIIPGEGLWKELLAEIKINGKPYTVKSNGRESRPLLKFDTGFSSNGGTISLMLDKHFLIEKCNAPDSSSCIEFCGKQFCSLKGVDVVLSFNNGLTFSVRATGRDGEPGGYALLGNAFFDHYRPVFDLKNNQLVLLSNE
jgi:hypothetical protein